MLEISSFKKSYHDNVVLDIAQLHFPKGIHWIKGINGSGKTTLFRSIAGLIPFEGKILLDGQYSPVQNPVHYRKLVNYGEAEPLYPEYLTGIDLIQFVSEAKGASQKQIDFLVNTLQMDSYVAQPTGTYSSGMTKKLSIALAFLGSPQVIILDEPLTTVDATAIKNIFHLILHYQKSYQTNFLISSHQLFEQTDIPVTNQYLVQNQTIQKIG